MKITFDHSHPRNTYRVFSSDERVAGYNFYLSNVTAFTKGTHQRLEFKLEPNNQYDENAICVFGYFKYSDKNHHVLLGYLDRETARYLYKHNLHLYALPFLKSIWVGGYNRLTIYINFKIIIPKSEDVINERIHRNKTVSYYDQEPSNRLMAVRKDNYEEKKEEIDYVSIIANCAVIFSNWLFLVAVSISSALWSVFSCVYKDLIYYDERKPSTVRLLSGVIGMTLLLFFVIVYIIKFIKT